MFKLIQEPEDNPKDLLKSYRTQNILMQKMRLLHTAFDGIKLTNWHDNNRELPNILRGSICEFGGRLFETTEDITLIDNTNNSSMDLRYIKLKLIQVDENAINDYLVVEVVGSNSNNDIFPEYDYDNRGFYVSENGILKEKYLRISMKYSKALGGYVDKKYWNINDIMRAGVVLKRHTVNLSAGTHTFNVPDIGNSITIHMTSGGGGGTYGILDTIGVDGSSGGKSEISINGRVITTCTGGKTGSFNRFDAIPGEGGIASGHGKLINGVSGMSKNGGNLEPHNTTLAKGGNGGNGSNNGISSAGGGSGSAAIVEITREMMAGSSRVQIIVGSGGRGGTNSNNHGAVANGDRGQDGSAVIEYFSRG